MQCHDDLLALADAQPELAGMATTLTLWLGVWPRAYLLQVGDSRCYLLREGELTQLSRDQTMAQELVDAGVLTRAEAAAPAGRTRSRAPSAAGRPRRSSPGWTRSGASRTPLQRWPDAARLRRPDPRRLQTMTSARQVCEDLLQDALDGGGTDNITILVGRTILRATDQ